MTPGLGVTVPSSFPNSLSLPATSREVAQFVALRAAACVGADYSNLALLTPDGNSLRLFHSPFLDADISARYTDVPLDAAYPIAVAVRHSRVVLLSDPDSYKEEFSGLVADTIAAGIQATASLPLYRFDGTPSRSDRVRVGRAHVLRPQARSRSSCRRVSLRGDS
jgi:hypothetical protein